MSSSKGPKTFSDKVILATFLIVIVQLLVAVFQLIMSFAYSSNIEMVSLGVFMVLSIGAILWLLANKVFKE